MMMSLQIFLGLLVGCIGFHLIADSPIPGSTALMVGGFLILSGVDHLFEFLNK